MAKNNRSERHTFWALAVGSLGLLGALLQCAQRPSSVATSPSSPASSAQVPRRLYSQIVAIPEGAKPALVRAGQELTTKLGRATGATFKLEARADRGIQLLRSDAAAAPADLVARLRDAGPEAYAIRSTGDGRLLIVANADDGLVFGAYQYLESLGFRFYFPNEHWTIVPHLDDIERRVDRVVKPAFRVRQFVGTGGFGKSLVMDPAGELGARWEVWKRQNGFGEEFHIDGHAGEGFNVRNKEILVENPDYLASVNGRRAAWSKIAKLDPSNSAALDLFARDRLQTYRAKKQRDPNGPGSFAVSVEPADGGGFCDSDDCEDIGTVSDQQFFVANHVARALAKEFPGARASMFAYNHHADVPNIAIEPNVYVTLVPYAFQRSGEDPEEFIERWTKKKSPLSIYDYWSIPDWVADLPVFDYREVPARKLRFWKSRGIEGFISESTYGAGAMGLAWYIAGHMMWDPSRDPAQLANEFYDDAFGPAGPAMRRMLERWASGFYLNSLELRASFSDLAEALRRCRSAEVRARLLDYAGYLQYLRLRQTWLAARSDEKQLRKRELIEHLWRVRASAMVNTFRLQQLLLRKERELGAKLDPTNADLPIWQSLAPVTPGEAEGWVTAGLHAYPDLGVRPRSYEGDLVAAPQGSATTPTTSGSVELTLVGTNRLTLSVPRDATEVLIQLKPSSHLRLRLRDARNATIASAELDPGTLPRTFSATISKAGSYVLELRTTKTGITSLSVPTTLAVELEEFLIPKAVAVPDLYFYVPQGEKAVALYDAIALPEGSGPTLRDGSGASVPVERFDGGRLLIARVPQGQAGRIWTLRRAVSPDATLRLLNVPQRLALTPQALRVPRQALAGSGALPR